MSRRITMVIALVLFLHVPLFAVADQPDSDGDGIWDIHEEVLGTDPHHAEVPQTILPDRVESDAARQRPTYDATKDVVDVAMCHVGGDRYLWKVTLVETPRLDDTVLHLYIDADADAATGRKGVAGAASTGTDYMLSIVRGRGSASYYDAQGIRTAGPHVSFAVQSKSVWITADVDLTRDGSGLRYQLYVLCHAITESGSSVGYMSDSTGKRLITGVPLSSRAKIMRLCDYRNNHHVAATFGLDILRSVLRSEQTLVVPHDQLQLDGFVIDSQTSRRWPHVRRETPHGAVKAKVPQSGRFYVGFMMYDDSAVERIGFFVNDRMLGAVVANQDNNRTWLHWLEEPLALRAGQEIELRAEGGSGRYGIINVLFLPQPPEQRRIEYRVENMASATHVDRPRRVTLSWTTTWPCPTCFEYGSTKQYGQRVEDERRSLVHRVVLDNLQRGATYHGVAVGQDRSGREYRGEDYTWEVVPPTPRQTCAATTIVPLTVANPHPVQARKWPITTGVPVQRGQLADDLHVRLLGPNGEVPAQIQLAGRWPGGSVRWLLVTFLADVSADSTARYQLEFGRDVQRMPVPDPIRIEMADEGAVIDSGSLTLRIDRDGNLTDPRHGDQGWFSSGAATEIALADSAGTPLHVDRDNVTIEVEQQGPIRAVLRVVTSYVNADQEPAYEIEKRVIMWRGLSLVELRHTTTICSGKPFVDLEHLVFRLPLHSGPQGSESQVWQVPLLDTGADADSDTKTLQLGPGPASVHQAFDDRYRMAAGELVAGRVIGAAVMPREGGVAVAVRDFWQNYPKALGVTNKGLEIGLFPPFNAGDYDAFPFEKEGHHLYYYLRDGHYRLKAGVSKTHEMLLSFASSAEDRRDQCRLFQDPLLATATPQWYCDSQVFYDVAARDEETFPLYEAAIDANIVRYIERRERQRDYGLMNFGDWYGERGANWGNIEYDTQHAFFLEYIRSGSRDALRLGYETELHNRDIDTVHWTKDPGRLGFVYIHQMGHVGNYYDKSVPGTLGFLSAGSTVSHAWVEGHFDHFFLTGDRRSYQAGCAVADYFIRKELGRPYDFHTCRVPGWHLIMLASAYAATNDPYYLNAAKLIVERVLETQDTQPRPLSAYQSEGREPFQVGGWSRMMVPGHCRCEPRHRGNAGFMVAVLLSGLKYYHDITGDPRVREAIIQGAHYLLNECYSDETRGFRYTSCPNTKYGTGTTPLMVEGIARAYLWTKDERFRRVLTEALPAGAGGSGYGKGFSMYYRMAPRVLADLKKAGLDLR